MSSFDPWTQNVTFYAADGETPIHLPIPQIDAFIKYLISVTVNYGTQLGAALAMLFVILIMTPLAKLRRPSGLLQVLVLVLCVIRMALLSAYFFSDFVEFYAFNTGDYSRVPAGHYGLSVAGNTFSLLLIIAVEACLMHQAWAMVALWPDLVRYLLAGLSICVALLTIGWRLTALIHQNIAILSASSNHNNVWISKAAVITNALSICWFCALFNAKLVSHLVQNRGILPVGKSVTPMEVLVMTNGVLMIIPVIFAGLEFGEFVDFESSSLTLTSVALILPLGTLAAQRVSQRYGIISLPDDISGPHESTLHGTTPSLRPLKGTSSTFTGSTRTNSTAQQVSVSSHCEATRSPSGGRDPIDVELGQIDGYNTQVRVNRDIEQREERIW